MDSRKNGAKVNVAKGTANTKVTGVGRSEAWRGFWDVPRGGGDALGLGER